MIAERGGIVSEEVGDFVNRQPMVDAGDGRSLHQVAGVEQDAMAAVGPFPADDRSQVGEAAAAVVERQEMGVKVVGVQDRQRPDFGRQRGRN